MKQIFFRLFVLAFFAFTAAFTAFSQSSENPVSPTAKEALKVLFKNGDIQMASIRSCKSQTTEAGDKTIFDYLSAIIANQAEPKTKNSLEYSVKLIKEKNKNSLWQIELTFNSLDEKSGDPWNQGFRFSMRTQNHQMIRDSFECTGN